MSAGDGYCPLCFAYGECGDDCITTVNRKHYAAKVDEVARLQSEIAALRSEIATLRSDARVRPIEMFQNEADAYDWRLTVGVNGQFWALRLPAGAHRDFAAAGIPVRVPTRKCWACDGRGGHFEQAVAHTDVWRTCDVCKGAK